MQPIEEEESVQSALHVDAAGAAQGKDNDSTATQDLPEYTPPNFTDAAVFFDAILPRRIVDKSQPSGYRLAHLGELVDENGVESEKYDFFSTSNDALNEFGVGVGLYFLSLKALGVVFLCCALLSIMAANTNSEHQNPKYNSDEVEVPTYTGEREDLQTPIRLLGSVYGVERSDLRFMRQGVSDIIMSVVLVVLAMTGYLVERVAVGRIDESQLTTRQYSVVVKNPPAHITDPDVYHRHFSQFGDVVLVTIALNNGQLLRNIAAKKEVDKKIATFWATELAMDSLPYILRAPRNLLKRWQLIPSIESLLHKSEMLRNTIKTLTEVKYKPWKVFVTFDLEETRNRCLEETAVNKRTLWRNSISNDKAVLHGHTLDVFVTEEPSDIIYEHSDISQLHRHLRMALSYFLCIGFLVACFFVVDVVTNSTGDIAVAIVVSLVNAALPATVKFITKVCEMHNNDVDFQRSVLFKLMAARCVNSALLIYIVTDYGDVFSLETLERIQNILIADAIATPLYRFSNVLDTMKKYIIAPLTSITQDQFNEHWQGAEWTLAERYSDVLKSVFTGIFYAVPLPTGLFITSFSMVSTYLVDKYSLFNLWKRRSKVGPELAYGARYFYFGTVFCHLYISLIYFANWPYRGVFSQDNGQKATCGFLTCDYNDDMTIIVFWGLPYHIMKIVLRVFVPKTKYHGGEASGVSFRSIGGMSAYVPLVSRNAFLLPYIVANISSVPTRYIPTHLGIHWEDLPDPKQFSVFNPGEFPYLPPGRLRECMSYILFYEKEEDDDISTIPDGSEPDMDIELPQIPSGRPKLQRQLSQMKRIIDDDLPTGWEKRECPSTGRVYYHDANTNTTHDVSPLYQTPLSTDRRSLYADSTGIGPASIVNLRQSHRVTNMKPRPGDVSLVKLPDFWEEKVTRNGVTYFVNHKTKTTHWDIPMSGNISDRKSV